MLFYLCSFGEIGKDEYQRNYNKSFSVGSSPSLGLECSFADVRIENGKSGSIEVNIDIELEASSDQKAEEKFNNIVVEFKQKGDRIEVSTSLEKSDWGNTSYEIIVNIKVPESTSLDANTSFGDLHIDRLSGRAEIENSYGELRINELSNNENDIEVSFGGVWIGEFGGGELQLEFGEGDIDRITGDCELSNSYGDLEIDLVEPGCKRLKVDCSFGDTDIGIGRDCSFTIDASASMGDVDLDREIEITRESNDWNSENYEAIIGSGEGKMDIECSFGDVKIRLR
jgi:hypothetical protein